MDTIGKSFGEVGRADEEPSLVPPHHSSKKITAVKGKLD